METGTQMKFQAAAYDADDKPISGVAFAWSLTNQRQGGSSLGRIDSAGMVSATGEGGAFVFATYHNETFPGLQQRWVAYAPVGSSPCRKRTSFASCFRRWGRRARPGRCVRANRCCGARIRAELYLNASLRRAREWAVELSGQRQMAAGKRGGVPRFGRGSMALDFARMPSRDGRF
jgi:hypothetical protein